MNYEAADRGIRAMNREDLKIFGRLKARLMNADELNVIREVGNAYEDLLGLAKQWLLEIAKQAYAQGVRDAGKRRKNGIDMEWLLFWMYMTDPVTLYKFIPEWERKKARLIEALPVAQNRGQEIDKALKAWTKQIGQAAISVTDEATLDAYRDCGVLYVEWVSEHDDRVCDVCEGMDGNVYPIDKVPPKPHWNCRCKLKPVFKVSGE